MQLPRNSYGTVVYWMSSAVPQCRVQILIRAASVDGCRPIMGAATCSKLGMSCPVYTNLVGPTRLFLFHDSFAFLGILHKSMSVEADVTGMWANAQPDGRPAEYRWRPVLNAAVWLAPSARVPCSNAANKRAQDLEDAK